MKVQKRTGQIVDFDLEKIENAIKKAFDSKQVEYDPAIVESVDKLISLTYTNVPVSVETIQDNVERVLMQFGYYDIAKTFILYREQRKSTRFVKERIDYMNQYSQSTDNAASSSETDGNANVTMKNVANLEGEVYKTTNRIIQRQRMKDELNILFPEVAKQYETDLDNHIIYTHDEASTPVLKQYCMAVSLYPLLTEGVGNIDGVTPSEPNDLQSFSGQITNLIFLLSSQCKGAVAVGEYFIALNYYVVKEFGDKWYEKLDCEASSPHCLIKRTVRDNILKAFKQFVWGVNQPAGNRSYQSPFTNISYYDHTYFTSLFGEFCYPDGSKPEWIAIDTLQRMFMKWFNQIRLKQVLTFPVETFAMVHNGDDIIDLNYKQLCAEMYAEGHSFFTYISDSADSLASCCRLRNELAENTFSPTSGLTGVMTGSCNVITLNINRIVQDWALTHTLNGTPLIKGKKLIDNPLRVTVIENDLKNYVTRILERVYKYHIAFKTMLYDLEDKGMFAASNGGYIHISKLYSTIGINGLNEAARFLGMKVSNNPEYIEFLQLILGTIKEQNKLHSIHDRKRPFLFNSEVVPAEGLGGKNYKWDKEDGYVVPEDENLYNSYFYNAHDNTSILDKFILHGHQTYQYTDGGSAAHINLEDHLSKEQYLKLIDFAIANGTNYFTFNIPNSKCEDCGKIIKSPIDTCPCCGSHNITQYTRVIGYLRPTKAFGSDRQQEARNRIYSDGKSQV
ncbi:MULTISPECIES: anaerobic ribonucleoside-triphosphate reductase [Bacteroides]|jgi:ribonucleoside-triphosphate reductase|uniref:Anaerobic ribonucleoside-triphosphate reductase n=1 Tax=Bacteroides ovatus TaxID=28116 RepID=A0A515IK55_BACOV|nr:anaerobic ribonucleoside-triphosphate reductase [Bacteroides ovatus]KDS19088.1 anaerobic ribonucleoside-triphosphate reductase [Bacteroides fragilis str. 3725 D9 ii]UWG72169.1 MAG: anaerobic ribonucleoside-triphosphate reductase [Bacteriophage sp.]DAN50820.1 MAG TPA: anaerobic ribonucleoside triphosphate reductase [Caudoviricetes sp.]KAA4010676.1 anaerobic ribonucleoside-triphosphate reductase [Bacteroides ovatus]KAA4010867.1 anaerobic ribonucleoside-triphosphate reductase [Bacteroides ovat